VAKSVQYTLAITLLSLTISYSAGSEPNRFGESLSYKVYVDDKPIGSERVETVPVTGGMKIKSTTDLVSAGVSRRLVTETEIHNSNPARYSLEITEGAQTRRYFVEFAGAEARVKIESGARSSERKVRVHDGVVLLDKDVWHQYRYLIEKYDQTAKGVQRCYVFSPQASMREFWADVEMKGATNYELKGAKRKANRFDVSIAGGTEVKVVVDSSNNSILSIEIPSLDTKVRLE
jgi:hypothetical protein